MNIFVLDEESWKAARMLDDQRLSKMIIESGQMLRAALARHGFTEEDCIEHHILTSKGTPWRVTHANHPCTIWAGDCRANFEWLAPTLRACAKSTGAEAVTPSGMPANSRLLIWASCPSVFLRQRPSFSPCLTSSRCPAMPLSPIDATSAPSLTCATVALRPPTGTR